MTDPGMGEGPLTHLDASGRARMVDVGSKDVTDRRARARAVVKMSPQTADCVIRGDAPKGDVLSTARFAAIQAVKRTSELIPLTHPLAVDFVDVDIQVDQAVGTVTVVCETRTSARTGVEMEALVGCSVAALTVYDMVKGIERGVTIEKVELLEKTGGKQDWRKQESG